MQQTRLQRINSEIKKGLTNIITNELRDPRLNAMISITDVDTTNDLSHCYIMVSVLAKDEIEVEKNFHVLEHSASFIRKLLTKEVDIRIMPYLHFKLDKSLEIDAKMSELISTINIPKAEEDNIGEK